MFSMRPLQNIKFSLAPLASLLSPFQSPPTLPVFFPRSHCVMKGLLPITKLHLDLGDHYGVVGKASVGWFNKHTVGFDARPQKFHGYLLN